MQAGFLARRSCGGWTSRLSRGLDLTVMGIGLLLWTLPVEARNPNFRLCFRQVINVPGPTFLQPPVIDGVINNDLGWTGAFRYEFGNGTPTSDVVVQGIRDATNLYMSFEVNNDQRFDDQDVIVIALDPDGTAANGRRIHIYPVFSGTGAAGGGNPREVEYWTNSATWNTGASPVALPAGVNIKVTSAGVGPVSWSVEVQLPLAAFSIPPMGDFGLYFNVIRVSAVGVPIGTAVEKFWPTDAPPIGLFLDTGTPVPNTWGNATLTGTCNGVSIAVADITTNNTPTSKISFPPGSNTFTATVRNNTVDGAGTPIAADQVTATFRIANFGIPAFGDWALVPTGNNPTSPGATIPASGSLPLNTTPWTLTPAQVTQYTAHPHQCILVELDSTAPKTVFVNKSAWRNMDFGMASKFERTADISGRGYRKPPAGRNSHVFDLYVTTREEVLRKPGDTAGVATRPTAQLTWMAHGLLHTGNFIIIKKRKFEIVDHVGSFGYFIQHAGPVAYWRHTLVGKGVKQVGKNIYQIQVPQNGVATVATQVEASEKGKRQRSSR